MRPASIPRHLVVQVHAARLVIVLPALQAVPAANTIVVIHAHIAQQIRCRFDGDSS